MNQGSDLDKYVDCPFCQMTDFDLIGLKRHFQNGYCDVFNDTPLDDEKTCSFCGFRRKRCDDINCPHG